MRLWTKAEIEGYIKDTLDLNDEDFISADELTTYLNRAIDDCEAEVLTLFEDYFLADTTVDLVAGTADYDIPADIWAHKIRRIFLDDGSDEYEIKRVRSLKDIDVVESDEDYRYIITQPTAGSAAKIRIFPTPASNLTGMINVWYIRNANKLVADTDVMDIPEGVQFVIQRVTDLCLAKEMGTHGGGPTPSLETERQRLRDTLSTMVPDENNKIDLDMSFYCDMDI